MSDKKPYFQEVEGRLRKKPLWRGGKFYLETDGCNKNVEYPLNLGFANSTMERIYQTTANNKSNAIYRYRKLNDKTYFGPIDVEHCYEIDSIGGVNIPWHNTEQVEERSGSPSSHKREERELSPLIEYTGRQSPKNAVGSSSAPAGAQSPKGSTPRQEVGIGKQDESMQTASIKPATHDTVFVGGMGIPLLSEKKTLDPAFAKRTPSKGKFSTLRSAISSRQASRGA